MPVPVDRPEHERALAACQERLRGVEEGEERLRMFLDCVQDYAFISFDVDGRVVGWSRGAEQILGYLEVDALGLPGSIFFTPEDVQRGEDERELLVAREAGRAEDERWHLRRDGVRFWGSGVMTRRVDADGRLRGYYKVMRDHTARRLAEARLRDSEQRLRMFSENVRDYALFPSTSRASSSAGTRARPRSSDMRRTRSSGSTAPASSRPRTSPTTSRSATCIARSPRAARSASAGWCAPTAAASGPTGSPR